MSQGSGISLNASSSARVHHNTVVWNEGGIMVHNSIRTDVHPEEGAYNTVEGVEVDHNDILQQGGTASRALWWVAPGISPYANLYDPAANNRGHDNRYWCPQPEGAHYHDKFKKLGRFNATFGEERSSYHSDAKKQQFSNTGPVPAFPEPALEREHRVGPVSLARRGLC
jgi:hypothetical protein